MEIVILKIADTKPEDELYEAFKLFDHDKKSYLNIETFKADLASYCKGIGEKEINDICSFLQIEKGLGLIRIDEAVSRIMERFDK